MRRTIDWDLASFTAVFSLVAAITVVVLVSPTLVILLLSFTGEESLHFPPAAIPCAGMQHCWTPRKSRRPPWSA